MQVRGDRNFTSFRNVTSEEKHRWSRERLHLRLQKFCKAESGAQFWPNSFIVLIRNEACCLTKNARYGAVSLLAKKVFFDHKFEELVQSSRPLILSWLHFYSSQKADLEGKSTKFRWKFDTNGSLSRLKQPKSTI